MRPGVLFMIILAFASCHFREKPQVRVVLTNVVHHKFSDNEHKDLFRLTITGDSITNGLAKFEIIDYKNRQIWVDTFRTYEFYEDGDTTLKQRVAIILKKAKAYFSEDNFVIPATDTAKLTERLNDVNEPEIWEELKNNRQSVGFICTEGYEGINAIAYSKKKGKVLCYFSCD